MTFFDPCDSYKVHNPISSPGIPDAKPPYMLLCSRPLNISEYAPAGAISLASILIAPVEFLAVIKAPPPIPLENIVSVAPMHKQVVTAASAAFPPSFRISTPICEQYSESEATIPDVEYAVTLVSGFHVGLLVKGICAGTSGTLGNGTF